MVEAAKQYGLVLKSDPNKATLLVSRMSACGGSCESCGAACAESKPEYIEVLNTQDLKPGDRVELLMDAKTVLKFISLVYGMPLIFLITGVIISLSLGFSQVLSVGLGFVMMIISYLIIKKIDSKFKNMEKNLVVKKI